MTSMSEAKDDRDPETVALFIEESLEGLQRIDSLLLDAERGQVAPDLMAVLFRDVHTIKGTSGFLALHRIQSLSHIAEDLLSRMRDKKLKANVDHYRLLLTVAERLRQMIDNLRATGDEGDVEVSSLIEQLRAALEEGTANDNGVKPTAPVATVSASRAAAPVPRIPLEEPAAVAPRILLEEPAPEPATADPKKAAEESPAARADASEGTVRVNVAVLDRLMNLIGELVLARNQIVQMIKVSSDSNVNTQAACQRLNLVTSDLQEQIMKTRMQPVARVFEKIPRMVRDLAKTTQKQVTTQIDGNATEIDKALVEAIRDPVMHIVRNAIDHGVESPAERLAKGKPASGKLSVRASHEGGMVTIEIEDDGRGMDPQALRAHAVRKQLLSAADAERLSDREALELVFRPGFSTAAQVSDISGRGVGMDVVRTHVERAGGQAEIDSVAGKGTSIRLKMPLTLAIIPALLVRTCGQRMAIPQVNLLELVYLNEEQSQSAIEFVRGAAIYRLRGEILPIVRLSSVLGLERLPADEHAGGTNIVVLAVGARRYGLIVDAIHDTEEIVIKPLHGQLKRLSCYSGATVLGDGGVALILDAAGVAMRAGIDMSTQRRAEIAASAEAQVNRQQFIVFLAGDGRQCAVPLSMVARLEQIPTNTIERVANTEVVQYRDTIMPIVRPEAILPLGVRRDAPQEQPLIVFDFGQMVAMAVNEIIDVVEVVIDGKTMGQDTAYALGKVVVRDRTTLLVDVYKIMRELVPHFVKERRRGPQAMRVMVVDDSNAMRAALAGYLRSVGMEVVDVASGEAALRELRSAKSGQFDAVVTDLDMPGVSGLDVLRTLKQEKPQLATFAWVGDDDTQVAEQALGAGARRCVHKLRREDLMDAFEKSGIHTRRREDRGAA